MRRGIFLDRDGTLIEDRGYLCRPEDIVLTHRAGDALRQAKDAGFALVLVTNQSGIGRGLFGFAELERVHSRLLDELGKHGAILDRIFVAPETPGHPSRGRKPSPQFLFDARDELGLVLEKSYMVGDKLIDLECGWNANVRKTLLVRTGYGQATERALGNRTNHVVIVDDLAQAIEWILKAESFSTSF